MTEFEIMSLAYQRQSAGDSRAIAEIATATKADIKTVFPSAELLPSDIVGTSNLKQSNGKMKRFEHFRDGKKREVV